MFIFCPKCIRMWLTNFDWASAMAFLDKSSVLFVIVPSTLWKTLRRPSCMATHTNLSWDEIHRNKTHEHTALYFDMSVIMWVMLVVGSPLCGTTVEFHPARWVWHTAQTSDRVSECRTQLQHNPNHQNTHRQPPIPVCLQASFCFNKWK